MNSKKAQFFNRLANMAKYFARQLLEKSEDIVANPSELEFYEYKKITEHLAKDLNGFEAELNQIKQEEEY